MKFYVSLLNKSIFGIAITLFSLTVYAEYKFSPSDCEFSVQFPEIPVIENSNSFELNQCKTTMASLILLNGTGGLKAECIICKAYNQNEVNDSTMTAMLREHAQISGVTNASYSYQEDKLGKIGIYRGQIESLGNVFINITIAGKKSSLSLSGSAPYKFYSKLNFHQFLKSVEKNQ